MLFRVLLFTAVIFTAFMCKAETDFERRARPFLDTYCVSCHSGTDANAGIDFDSMQSAQAIEDAFETWEAAVRHVEAHTMPPADSDVPTDNERQEFLDWFHDWRAAATVQPATLRPRRLSVIEYRNTLKSLMGFDLEVVVTEAEQTITERSLVIKLLPTDPPGDSGFTNDTHKNPLNAQSWDQYSYLTDIALEELFSSRRQQQLKSLCGAESGDSFSVADAERLLKQMLPRIRRRPLAQEDTDRILKRLRQTCAGAPNNPAEVIQATRLELKAALLAPEFLYRSLLVKGEAGTQSVDDFELAERLSYFLWADMPDDALFRLAADGKLQDEATLSQQVARMLADEKARSLSEVFASQWFHLNEIEHVSDNVPVMVALKSQPLDFLHHLFTDNRPLLELIDSRTAFISPHTARHYGRDARQMTKYRKQKGIEVEIVANQQIALRETTTRGGLLTMPGILAMNRGPILRGTWMLESILGQPLPDPPPDVGQVEPNRGNTKLTFRQRFEQHRSQAACAVCHDKIDPLGFALESYDRNGAFRGSSAARKKNDKGSKSPDNSPTIDTSGTLPSGETFNNFQELKSILKTTQRRAVLRNIVQRTLKYALCRKLSIYDQPVVDEITEQMDRTNGTWSQLMTAVVNSVPFRQTILQ